MQRKRIQARFDIPAETQLKELQRRALAQPAAEGNNESPWPIVRWRMERLKIFQRAMIK